MSLFFHLISAFSLPCLAAHPKAKINQKIQSMILKRGQLSIFILIKLFASVSINHRGRDSLWLPCIAEIIESIPVSPGPIPINRLQACIGKLLHTNFLEVTSSSYGCPFQSDNAGQLNCFVFKSGDNCDSI